MLYVTDVGCGEEFYVGSLIFDNAEGAGSHIYFYCPVCVGADLVHFITARAFDNSAGLIAEYHTGIVVFLFGDSHEGIYEPDVGGVYDCSADEAVGFIEYDFA